MGAPAPPGRRKKFRRNLQKRIVSAPTAHQVHPQAEKESIFRTFLVCGEDMELLLVVFRPSLEGDD